MSLDLGALVGRVVLEDVAFQRTYVRLVRQFGELGGKAAAAANGTNVLDTSLGEAAAAGDAAATGLGRAQKAMTEAGVSASTAAAATGRQAAATTEAGLASSKLTQAQLRQAAAQARLDELQASGTASARALASAQATVLGSADRAALAEERLGKATGATSAAWQGAGRAGVVAGGLVAAGFAYAAHEAMQFDAELANIRALLGHNGTAADMANLREAALTAGQAFGYTADQVAAAEAEEVKAGISVRDMLGGALPGALTLAAAGQEDVASATETAAVAMTQFRLQGKDVPHIADLLAAGADKALGSVHDLSEALKYGGLAAAQAGFSIDETVGVLAELAQSGQIGSMAGAQLAMMLRNLQKPTDAAAGLMKQLGITVYDQTGQMRSAADIAGQLHDKIGGLPPAQRDAALATLFTSRAVRAANILMREGSTATQGWIDKVNDAGFAAHQASGKLDSLSGDATKLRSALQTALIGTGEDAQGPLRGMTQDLTHVIQMWNALPGPVRHVGEVFIAVGGAVTLLGGAFLILIPKIAATRAAMTEMNLTSASMRGGLGRTAGFLSGPWGLALAAATIGIGAWAARNAEAKQHVEDLTNAIEADSGALGKNTRETVVNRLEKEGLLEAARKAGLSLATVTDAAMGNAAAIRTVTDASSHQATQIGRFAVTNQLGRSVQAIAADTEKARQAAKDHATAMSQEGSAASGAAGQVDQFGNAVQGAGDKTKTAADAAKNYADRLHALADPLFAMNKALEDLRAKQHDVNEATRKYGANSRQAHQAQLDLASSSLDVAAASDTLTAAVKDGSSTLGQARARLHQWVAAGLLTEGQAKAVARSFGGLIDKAGHVERAVRGAGRGTAAAHDQMAKLPPLVQAMITKLQRLADSAEGAGHKVGFDFGNGMVIGLNDATGPVEAQAAKLARSAAAAARSKKGIDSNSPSRVGHKIGGEFGQGVANGIEASSRAVAAATGKMTAAARQRAISDLGGQIQSAQSHLSTLRGNAASMSSGVASGLTGAFDLSNAPNLSVKGITSFLSYGAHATERFNRLERRLIKQGYDPAIVQQIAAMGVGPGTAAALNLVHASAAERQRINHLERRLDRAATRTGQAVSKQQFGNEMRTVVGELRGLRQEMAHLRNEVGNVSRNVRLEHHKSTVRAHR